MYTLDQLPDLLSWARAEADRIRNAYPAVGAITPGVEFLRRYAGAESDFYLATRPIMERARHTGTSAARTALVAMSGLLESWAEYAETSFARALPFAVAARLEAADDLMEQVARLSEDRDVHPAASVMLAGAALEEFLRALWSSTLQPLNGQPGITRYGEALRKAELLTGGDGKELIALADIRNDAAHGRFDLVSRERAVVFADRVNLFLRQHSPGLT